MQGWSRRSGRGRARLTYRPVLERVEARELLSGILASMMTSQAPPIHRQAPGVQAQASETNGGGNSGIPGTPPPPLIPGTGEPTPHELARERFRAVFSGPVYVGGPRFTDQKKTLYFRGLGGSTSFLHGDYQMGITYPRDPSKPITGGAYLQDKNINSGGQLGFDLKFDPSTLDRHGRPTVGTFTEDPNIYGGAFFAPIASGTVKIRYAGNTATVLFQGRLYVSGITNALTNQDLQERGG